MAYDGTLKFDTEIDVKGLEHALRKMDKILKMESLTKSIEEIAGSVKEIQPALGAVQKAAESMEKRLPRRAAAKTFRFRIGNGCDVPVFQKHGWRWNA